MSDVEYGLGEGAEPIEVFKVTGMPEGTSDVIPLLYPT
jgi:hypothetical protein